MGIRVRRPDAAPDVLDAVCTSTGEQHKAPPDTQSGESAQACLRRKVPTDEGARSHAAGTAAGARVATTLRFGWILTWTSKEANAKHDRIHTQALSENGPVQDGDVNVKNRSNRILEPTTSTRSARRERVVLGTSRSRAAREGACGGKHVGQHVDGRTARRKQGLAAMECHDGRPMECHGDRKRRARTSNAA